MVTRLKSIAWLTLLFAFVASVTPQTTSPSRTESEKVIRIAYYESVLAAYTGDVEGYKKRAARRTLELYDVIYEELIKNRELKERYVKLGITSGSELMAAGLRAGASRLAGRPKAEIEEAARKNTSGSITFLSDNDAKLEGEAEAHAVIESGEWKIDETRLLKRIYSQHKALSEESRARIERF